MSNLKEVCEQVIKLKAIADNPSHYDDKEDFWIAAKNNAEKLARACLILMEEMNGIMKYTDRLPMQFVIHNTAKQALYKANALFNKEDSK